MANANRNYSKLTNLCSVFRKFSTINDPYLNFVFKPLVEYKITFWICVFELWVHKGYYVVKKLVRNVCIKALCYTRLITYNFLIKSAKKVLLQPKYEIIMVPSNHCNFQYCDSYIGLFSIASCKVITINPLCILFGISSLLLFWWLSL